DGAAVPIAAIAELSVGLRRIDVAKVDLEQRRVVDAARIVDHAHGLDVAGVAARDLFVGRRGGPTAGVAADGVAHALERLERRLHAPEAAARENGLGQAVSAGSGG